MILFDTYQAITESFQYAMRDLGHEIPNEIFLQLVNNSLDYCISTLSDLFKVPEKQVKQFKNQYGKIHASEQPPFEGVSELCEIILGKKGKNFFVTHRRKESSEKLL